MKILVWENKYGSVFYDASSSENLEAAAASILQQLLKDNWIYRPSPPSFSEEELEAEAMSDEALAVLPESLLKQVNKLRAQAARRKDEFEEELEEYEELQKLAAGEKIYHVWHAKATYGGDWDNLVEEVFKRYENLKLENDVLYRPFTAWSALEDRNGYEYENYSVESVEVITPGQS